MTTAARARQCRLAHPLPNPTLIPRSKAHSPSRSLPLTCKAWVSAPGIVQRDCRAIGSCQTLHLARGCSWLLSWPSLAGKTKVQEAHPHSRNSPSRSPTCCSAVRTRSAMLVYACGVFLQPTQPQHLPKTETAAGPS
jgi:hypothetical protein